MKEGVFWQEEAGWAPDAGSTELPPRVDAAVVGAGITGLSAAVTLARLGASVAVFDAHEAGWGASSRNGGMTLTGLKHHLGGLIHKYGREKAARLFFASVECIDQLERTVAEEGIECSFHRPGGLTAAYRPSHLRALGDEQELLQGELGYETELVQPGDLMDELHTTLYHGGLLDRRSGALQPARYSKGLLAAARRRGALVFARAPVVGLEGREGRFRLTTAAGTVAADEVIMATNGYTGDLHPGFRRRLVPLGSYIIATEPLGTSTAEKLIPHGRMIFDTKRVLFYFRRTPDDRILFGGRASFTPTDARHSAAILRHGLVSVFPELEGVRIDYSWSGQVAFTFDLLPHLGVLDGVHYALGYCGHGVAMGTLLGHQIALLAAGQQVESPFLGLEFPARIFYRRQPWFLPLAGAYFQLRDRLPA